MEDEQPAGSPPSVGRLARVQASAQGWHTVQLAALGFVGLCGVLKSAGNTSAPRAVQVLVAVLVLSALALACWATYLVARVAWPLPGGAADAGPDDEAQAGRAGRRLRTGIALTFAAVALMSVAATSSWWPDRTGSTSAQVEVQTSAGALCGTLTAAPNGFITLRIKGRSTDIPLGAVTGLRPVPSCP
ncbi:hypothetical protein QMK19_08455 [Streptomyces sp. H10-C2]|uniref:hypothetical protein n=1 Tax=unclassified Streptomyces TaxID=2593676 RepID=UPI0024BAADAE|nr:MULTISPECIES: hypothetical protein [unclassified Streptomyces]MDJ0341059.1 hypothetical protein [Streptomyces sp. PH10-H1]MDJ0369709.1 hypothetical protein [Streptomyces sp. H10-C2]